MVIRVKVHMSKIMCMLKKVDVHVTYSNCRILLQNPYLRIHSQVNYGKVKLTAFLML